MSVEQRFTQAARHFGWLKHGSIDNMIAEVLVIKFDLLFLNGEFQLEKAVAGKSANISLEVAPMTEMESPVQAVRRRGVRRQ